MGQPPVPKPCYCGLCLDERIPPDHLLRKMRTQVDFDFACELVRPHYGVKGNVSASSWACPSAATETST